MSNRTPKATQVVIFTRVSTTRQEDSHSLGSQLKRLQEYCSRCNLNVIKEYRVLESSTIGERKQFNEMIKFVKAQNKRLKEPVGIVVYGIDRLQRNFKEQFMIDEMRQNKIIEVHFYKEGFVLHEHSPSSDIMRWDFGIMGAKMYVAAIADNAKKGNKYAWEKGLWTGRPPIGYKKSFFDNGKFTYVLDETRACYIKKIFELYATGLHSLKSLEKKCREWNLTSNKSVKNQPIDKTQ